MARFGARLTPSFAGMAAGLRSLFPGKRKNDWFGIRTGADSEEMILEDAAYNEKMLNKGAIRIDDITWNDLEMDRVYRALRLTQSTFGDEALYAMLRAPKQDPAVLDRRLRLVNSFETPSEQRTTCARAFNKSGHHPYHGALTYLERAEAIRPRHLFPYVFLAFFPIVFLILGAFDIRFLIGLGFLFGIDLIVYYLSSKQFTPALSAIRHIASAVTAAEKLAKIVPSPEISGQLTQLTQEMGPVKRWSPLFAMQRTNDFDVFSDYLRVFAHLDMICFYKLTDFYIKHRAAILDIYRLVGEIDACMAVAAFRAEQKPVCSPQWTAGKGVAAKGLVHPLVAAAVPNDITWDECLLLTGSNASGKSTFIKAMAINLILAQSIVTCTAESFKAGRLFPLSSMALRDSVVDGDSYFIAEIKSMKRILDAAAAHPDVCCFVDEVLRGTNTIERIAASSSVLACLQRHGCLTMAATHDLELTALLPQYRQAHFRETLTDKGLFFEYRLHDGPCATRNAIALLGHLQFPKEIVTEATERIRRFEQEKKWS